jgi:hypothetical protein
MKRHRPQLLRLTCSLAQAPQRSHKERDVYDKGWPCGNVHIQDCDWHVAETRSLGLSVGADTRPLIAHLHHKQGSAILTVCKRMGGCILHKFNLDTHTRPETKALGAWVWAGSYSDNSASRNSSCFVLGIVDPFGGTKGKSAPTQVDRAHALLLSDEH